MRITEERGGPVGAGTVSSPQRRSLSRGEELVQALKRHVGHTLRCSRARMVMSGYSVESVALRCDDCGEVILEGTARVRTGGGRKC